MAELLLLRHGKAEADHPQGDYPRTLKTRGKRDAQRIGHWLERQGLKPDCIISSGAERARLTAEKCAKVMGVPAPHIQFDDSLYLATPEQIWDSLQPLLKRCQRVLLVAHNPGLEQLLQQLLEEPLAIPEDGKLMPTATLAHLSAEQNLAPGCWQLQQLVRPRSLPQKFDVQINGQTLWRDRPAYYYTQSGVLAYRLEQGTLQLLMFRSVNSPRWKLAKGIVEPGLSAAESAEKEALEEMGIRGEIDPVPLGDIRHAKWGGECRITLFPLKVTAAPADDKWWHDSRLCQWISPEDAARHSNFTGLEPLIQALQERLQHE